MPLQMSAEKLMAEHNGGYRLRVVPSRERLSHHGSSPTFMATRGGHLAVDY
jgi:hypothetical protein